MTSGSFTDSPISIASFRFLLQGTLLKGESAEPNLSNIPLPTAQKSSYHINGSPTFPRGPTLKGHNPQDTNLPMIGDPFVNLTH